MLGNCLCFFVVCRLFLSKLFQKFFQEHDQSVKQFGSRSGPTVWVQTFAKVICRRQNSSVAMKKFDVHKSGEMSIIIIIFFLGEGFFGGGSFLCILIYSHTYGVREVKAQARLCICTVSHEYLLVAYAAIG